MITKPKGVVNLQPELNKLKQIDELLFDELKEVSEFEAELFSLEYELDDEERIVAKLHNACRTTIITIRNLHSLIRKMNNSSEAEKARILKNMIKRQISHLENDIDDLMPKLDKLKQDEKAGEKVVKYCKRVESIIRKKISELKERFEGIEKI